MPPRIPFRPAVLQRQTEFCQCLRTPARTFTSTTHLEKSPVPKKSKSQTVIKDRSGSTLRLSKRTRVKDSKPPAPGERKLARKRIVLSNTNALEVAGLKEINARNASNYTSYDGKVMALPDDVVSKLREVEAFKTTQGWNFFRRPACLFREDAVKMGKWMDDISGKLESLTEGSGIGNLKGQTIRRILDGERKSGKSVLLLQAMTQAFLRNWVVIHLPEARDLTNAHTEYAPVPKSDPLQFSLPDYTATLLGKIARANTELLTSLEAKLSHSALPTTIKGMNLFRLAQLGATEPSVAWPVFQALWAELTIPGRPPILFTADSISHFTIATDFQTVDGDGKLHKIHAFDVVLIKHFIDCLSGTTKLPNGGMVLGATSGSDIVNSDALKVALKMAASRRADVAAAGTEGVAALPAPSGKKDAKASAGSATALTGPLTPGGQPLSVFWDLYKPLDMRVLSPLTTVDIIPVGGFSKEEARRVIEYWAGSGMVRKTVDAGFVGEKWTVCGGGVIGEMERSVVKSGRY